MVSLGISFWLSELDQEIASFIGGMHSAVSGLNYYILRSVIWEKFA